MPSAKTTPPTLRILGIDPGSVVCGFGVIDVAQGKNTLVEYGVIELKRRTDSFPQRLNEVFMRLKAVIERTQPDVCALETVFHGKNVLTIVRLAHARGAAMLSCMQHGLEPVEYTPMQVKRSVTGRGAATKEQVRHMVQAILGITEDHRYLDATDALAVALCHALHGGAPPPIKSKAQRKSKRAAWADFVEKNSDKIR
jgi:crossover junction endodeoxyribonuclease RuvC